MLNLLLEGGGNIWVMLPLLLIIVAMLVFSSISNKKKQKEAQNMVNSLKKGDRVKTIGGICGFVVEVYDAENTFVLETGTENNKSYIKFDKAAIYQTAPKEGYANPKPNEDIVEETVDAKPEETVEVKTESAPVIEETETVAVEDKPKTKKKSKK